MAHLHQPERFELTAPACAAAVLVAILIAGIAPASADAGRSWTKRAEAAAADYWSKRGRSCDSGTVRVKLVPNRAVPGDALTTVGGCLAWGEEYETMPDESVIRISRHARQVGWLHFCSLVIHEYGHLLGLEHSRKRGNIMFPGVRGKNLQRRAC